MLPVGRTPAGLAFSLPDGHSPTLHTADAKQTRRQHVPGTVIAQRQHMAGAPVRRSSFLFPQVRIFGQLRTGAPAHGNPSIHCDFKARAIDRLVY